MRCTASASIQIVKTIYIIEDDPALQNLLEMFVNTGLPEFEFVGSCGEGGRAIRECEAHQPDLIILDIRLPEVNGLEILHLLKRKIPRSKIIIYSGTLTLDAVKIAEQGKVDGFVAKTSGLEDLIKAIEEAFAGRVCFSEEAAALRR